MSDLIERNAVMLRVREFIGNPTYNEKMLVNDLNALPSAEPERKKGQWSNYKDEHCCSVCKCVVISDCWDDEIRYDYCPYCGAEME